MKVVVTNHGPEYNRKKWGKVAKTVLKIGEKVGGVYANEIIVISKDIKKIIEKRCNRNSHLIYNGVDLPEKCVNTDYIRKIGVEPKTYILAVSRFVPEKGLHDLIDAFQRGDLNSHLVIAGDADHETQYSRSVKEKARGDHRIVLTGYITGDPLHQLYSNARLFVLPSYHEGLPIVLLEAMSYDLPILASDISANKAVPLPEKCFFRCGDIEDLHNKMKSILAEGLSNEEREDIRQLLIEKYNWETIASQTLTVYKKILGAA
jgi:glycosyltransferase involved in cell wall biosynthesis